MYPYKNSLLFCYILVLHNRTKAHILQFYTDLILVNLNIDKTTHKYLSFSHCYSQQMFCEKLCIMIIWFWHHYTIIHQLEHFFLKVIFCFFFSSVFIAIYVFNQAFWLNLNILCSFLTPVHGLKLALDF